MTLVKIEDAAVVLHLQIRVKPENLAAFGDYVRDAFPVFEQHGDCKGVVYVDASDPAQFDEVFYYASEQAYQAGERAIREDPIQVTLLERWRRLLDGPPLVSVQRKFTW